MTKYDTQIDTLVAVINFLETHKKKAQMKTAIIELRRQLNLVEMTNDKRK